MTVYDGRDTPVMTTPWCPGCEPTLDHTTELREVRRCADHPLMTLGHDDRLVRVDEVLGYGEAGGEANRQWCDLLHRGRR